jgi:hypothetical protein
VRPPVTREDEMKDPCPASISGMCLQMSTGWPHPCPDRDVCDEEPWNVEREGEAEVKTPRERKMS